MKIFETLLEVGTVNFLPIILFVIPIVILVLFTIIYKRKNLFIIHSTENYNSKEIKRGYVSKFSEIGIGFGSLAGIALVLFQHDSFWIGLCIGIGGTLGFLLDIYSSKRNNHAN